MYRQGDVLLEPVEALPAVVKALKEVKGRHVLAEGEATGHAHTVRGGRMAKFFEDAESNRFLQVLEATPLEHQEHSAIDLPEGVYRVRRQREYSPQEIRNVLD